MRRCGCPPNTREGEVQPPHLDAVAVPRPSGARVGDQVMDTVVDHPRRLAEDQRVAALRRTGAVLLVDGCPGGGASGRYWKMAASPKLKETTASGCDGRVGLVAILVQPERPAASAMLAMQMSGCISGRGGETALHLLQDPPRRHNAAGMGSQGAGRGRCAPHRRRRGGSPMLPKRAHVQIELARSARCRLIRKIDGR